MFAAKASSESIWTFKIALLTIGYLKRRWRVTTDLYKVTSNYLSISWASSLCTESWGKYCIISSELSQCLAVSSILDLKAGKESFLRRYFDETVRNKREQTSFWNWMRSSRRKRSNSPDFLNLQSRLATEIFHGYGRAYLLLDECYRSVKRHLARELDGSRTHRLS